MFELQKYLKKCDGVIHFTFDPKGPGCVRLHLVPPKKKKIGVPWVCIINGYSVIPIQTSWAVLLKIFIEQLSTTSGELSDSNLETVKSNTVLEMKALFPKVNEEDILSDLDTILKTIVDLSNGVEPSSEIGYMTLAEYGNMMPAPHRMDLMISSMEKGIAWNCNQKCIHCYANEPMAKVSELTTEEWFKILDKLKDACVPAVTFTGGEPTIRKDLVELVDHAQWFVTRLNTNGILLTKELCKSLYEASLDSCQVTLYSADKKIHNFLVGGDHFDETILGIKNAVEAGLDVSINTPLCTLNTDYLSLVKLGESLGVKYFSSSALIPSGNAKMEESTKTKLTVEELKHIIDEAYSYTSQHELELSFTSPGWLDKEFLSPKKMVVPSCGACLSNMAIAPNGNVIPCQSWLFEDALGDLVVTNEFKEIWESKECVLRRKNSMKNTGNCPLTEIK